MVKLLSVTDLLIALGCIRACGPKLRELVDKLTDEVIGYDPDLTIVIDIDPEISL